MPLVTPILALLTNPVRVACLAREVVESGSRVLIILQCHTLQGFVREETQDAVTY